MGLTERCLDIEQSREVGSFVCAVVLSGEIDVLFDCVSFAAVSDVGASASSVVATGTTKSANSFRTC